MKTIKLMLMAVLCMILPIGSVYSMRGLGKSNTKKKTAPRRTARAQVAPRGAKKPVGAARVQKQDQHALKPLDGNLDALVADFTQEEYELNFGENQQERRDGAVEGHDNNVPGDVVVAENHENLDAFMTDLTPEEYELNYGHKANVKPARNGLVKVVAPVLNVEELRTIDRKLAIQELFTRVKEGNGTIADLLKRGADINATIDGLTPLLWAVLHDKAALCTTLINNGASLSIPMNGDFSIEILVSPVLLALGTLEVPLCWVLHLQPQERDKDNMLGLTALHLAACLCGPATVEALIDAGADCNALTFDGWTPLLLASVFLRKPKNRENLVASMKLLVERGADVNIGTFMTRVNHDIGSLWFTPLCNAIYDVEMRTYLLEKGAHVNIHNNMAKADGRLIPLMYAAERSDIDLCRVLLKAGADARFKNSDGESIWQIASRMMQPNLCEALFDEAHFLPTEAEAVDAFNRVKATLLTFNALKKAHGLTNIPRDIRYMILLKLGLKNDIMTVMFDRAQKGKPIPQCFARLILPWLQDYKIRQLQDGMGPVHAQLMANPVLSDTDAQFIGLLDPDTLVKNFGSNICESVMKRFGPKEAPKKVEEPKPEN